MIKPKNMRTAAPPTVTGLAALSPLRGEVQVGWKLAEVDGVDVSTMTGAAATQLLEERAANARRLEFDRTLPPRPKYDGGEFCGLDFGVAGGI